ncbi:ABC transporter permease [Flavobacterium sp. RHBU_24]|uniref:ABC transporter permease n=1 Tax=Flavobacterium sp. RHBU_24 TaxID=3391185 RepID=UPI003984854D
MKRLLSIELQKLWLNRSSRILIISYFVILSFIAFMASIEIPLFGQKIKLADQGIFNFPFIWHFNSYIAVLLKGFLGIVIVSMMANEYTYGTLKQNLIDGLSKKEFIASKILTVALFAAASTAFIFVMTLILGYCHSSFTEASIVFSDLHFIVAYFFNLLGFFSLCLFAGILIKRSAFALGFIIVLFIVEWLLWLLMRFGIGLDEETTWNIFQFFPMESFSELLVMPWERLSAIRTLNTIAGGESLSDNYSIQWYTFAIAITWTAVFMYLSYKTLKKRDL